MAGLVVVHIEKLLEALFGFVDGGRFRISAITSSSASKSFQITLQNMRVGFGFAKTELGAPNNDLNLVGHPHS
jgi:hypothetical protein